MLLRHDKRHPVVRDGGALINMNELARGGVWGFDGSITSDCGASRAIW